MDLHEACNLLRRRESCSLTLLNLSGQGIGFSGVKSLLVSGHLPSPCDGGKDTQDPNRDHSTVASNVSLPFVVLWLEDNEMYPRCADALKEVVLHSPKLKYLYMAHNSIGNKGVETLARTALSQLNVFNLADNEIGVTGAKFIAESLSGSQNNEKLFEACCNVSKLILESNRLGDEGVVHIAQALRSNTNLHELDLRYNQIGVNGLEAIRDCLIDDNTTLRRLQLQEVEDDEHCKPDANTSHPRKYLRLHSHQQQQQGRCRPRKGCSCRRCQVRLEIDYYVNLNRAGRHSFGNMNIHPTLWTRTLSRVSTTAEDPSVLYSMLKARPEMLNRNSR